MALNFGLVSLVSVLLFFFTVGRLSDYHLIVRKDERGNHLNQCQILGYDGLAVLNTPERYMYAMRLTKTDRVKDVTGFYIGLFWQEEAGGFVWDDGSPLRSDAPLDREWHSQPSSVHHAARLAFNDLIRAGPSHWQRYALCGFYEEKTPSVQESWGRPVRGKLNTAPNTTILSVTKSTYSYPECALMCGMDAECRAAEFNSDLLTCTLIGEYTTIGSAIATKNVMTYVRQKY